MSIALVLKLSQPHISLIASECMHAGAKQLHVVSVKETNAIYTKVAAGVAMLVKCIIGAASASHY